MALRPKDNQLAVLATLSERKQVAGAEILLTGPLITAREQVQSPQFTTDLQKGGKAKSRSIMKALPGLPS